LTKEKYFLNALLLLMEVFEGFFHLKNDDDFGIFDANGHL